MSQSRDQLLHLWKGNECCPVAEEGRTRIQRRIFVAMNAEEQRNMEMVL
jgi:hypothetical protein